MVYKEININNKVQLIEVAMNNYFLILVIFVIVKTTIVKYNNRTSIRPGLRPNRGDGILFGIIIGIGFGILISVLFNHFVFVIIGLLLGHYIGLIIEVLACQSSSKEIISYRNYSLIATIGMAGILLYLALIKNISSSV